MSNAADVVPPAKATHVHWVNGGPTYYQRTSYQHMNQVSGEWQTLAKWLYWDTKCQRWIDAGPGLSTRNFKDLK